MCLNLVFIIDAIILILLNTREIVKLSISCFQFKLRPRFHFFQFRIYMHPATDFSDILQTCRQYPKVTMCKFSMNLVYLSMRICLSKKAVHFFGISDIYVNSRPIYKNMILNYIKLNVLGKYLKLFS